MRTTQGFLGAFAILLSLSLDLSATDAAEKTRNPFGVPDIIDPDGKDVQRLAARVELLGGAKDPNARQWVKNVTKGKEEPIDGAWSERWNSGGGGWNYGNGPTQIKAVGDRVYFLVHSSNGKFLIDLKRHKDYLIGRYRGITNPSDTGPCVFLVVDNQRIDGNWSGAGRWDFRRKLK